MMIILVPLFNELNICNLYMSIFVQSVLECIGQPALLNKSIPLLVSLMPKSV